MLRIFLTSNQLSTIFYSIYVKDHKKEGVKDILIIDYYYKKESLVKLIHESASFSNWDGILDYSIRISDSFDLKPSVAKKLSRKWKNKFLIKWLYDLLLKRNNKKKAVALKSRLEKDLASYSGDNVVLNMLTQTALNDALILLYPKAEINYFEHGQGDYYYIIEKRLERKHFYCLFADLFKKYLERKGIPSEFVSSFIAKETYESAMVHSSRHTHHFIQELKHANKKYILFLMDASEIYHPPHHFWTDYIKKCVSLCKDLDTLTFIVKPHPNQSNEVMEITKQWFAQSGLNFIMLDEPVYVSLSAESIFVQLKGQIECVFTTFSSAIFYLSYLFPNDSNYYLLYEFVGTYFTNAPEQYKKVYKDLKGLYSGLFSELPLVRIGTSTSQQWQ